jgi:hypothetical protein
MSPGSNLFVDAHIDCSVVKTGRPQHSKSDHRTACGLPALLEHAAKSHAAGAQRPGRRERDKGGLLNSRLGSRFALDRSCDPAIAATRKEPTPMRSRHCALKSGISGVGKYRTSEESHAGMGTEDSASADQRQCERNGRGRGRQALKFRQSRNELGNTFDLWWFREM